MGKLAHLLELDSPPSREAAEQLRASRERDDQWKAMLAEVDQQLTDLHEHLDMVEKQAEMDRARDIAEMAKMCGEIDTLRQIVTKMVDKSTKDIKAAVGNIRIPVIPEQVKTDLTPVLKRLDAMAEREAMDAKNKTEPAEKPEEWVFDVQRGPNGGIVKVVAREV